MRRRGRRHRSTSFCAISIVSDWPLYRWFFFRFDGRISRVPYLLGFMLLSIAQAFPFYRFMLVPPESSEAGAWSVMFLFVFFPTMFSLFALSAKRLHDFGQNGIASISLAIPVVSIIAFVYLCIKPGDEGQNAYGRAVNYPDA